MLALSLLIAVLFLVGSSMGVVAPTCCTGENCPISENAVTVNSLCASTSICINGQQVPPGVGNPCFNTDIDPADGSLQSVPIKDCCKVPADCTRFQPAAVGYTSSCTVDAGKTYGFCEHSTIVGFCTSVDDCPDQACMTKACGGSCPTSQDFFFTEHLTTKKRSVFDARNSVHTLSTATTCHTCQYTPVPAGTNGAICCADDTQCQCPAGQSGICSLSTHKCLCFCSSCNNPECTTDADCASVATDPALAFQATCKGPCFENQCVGGFCELQNNPTLDADHDNVPCNLDCNDTDASVSTPQLCIALFAGMPPVSNDADGDGFFKCGSLVTKFCLGTCPDGFVALTTTQQVPADLTSVSGGNSSQFILHSHCDACDDNTSKASPKRPDEVVCCEATRKSDQAKVCNPGDLQVCLDVLPVPAPATDGRCNAWAAAVQAANTNPDPTDGVDLNKVSFVTHSGTCDVPTGNQALNGLGNRKRDVGGVGTNGDCTCTVCPDEATQCQNSLTCLIDCDGDKVSSCKVGESMTQCCTRLTALSTTLNTGNQQFVNQAVLTCCSDYAKFVALPSTNSSAKLDDPTLFVPSCTDGTGGTAVTTPVLSQRCSCPTGYINSTDALNPTNGFDLCECDAADNDPTPGQTFIYNCTIDGDHDGVGDCSKVKTICSNKATAALACAAQTPPMIPSDPTMCDCNDTIAGAQFTIACSPDVDGDGFPDCMKCDDECLATCPAGFLPTVKPTTTPSPPSGGGGRRRSALDAIQGIANQLGKRQVTTPTPAPPTCAQLVTPTPDYCDCADADFFAHPKSIFCSTSPIVGPRIGMTPDHDYDCNGHNNPVTYCLVNGLERTGTDAFIQNGTRIIRPCFDVGTGGSQTSVPETFPESTTGTDTASITSGECVKGTTTCTPTTGFCPDQKKKRTITTAAPAECTTAVPTPDIDDTFNPVPGNCYDYLDECATSKSTPIKCSCECHICVLVDH
jgi:hypothetical protein